MRLSHSLQRRFGAMLIVATLVTGGRALGADRMAVVNARVIDLDRGEILDGRTILIEDGRIVAVTDAPIEMVEGTVVVDAAGRFALPGLIDSHVHYTAPDVYDPLMIAHGVVMVREMGGETAGVLAMRDERESGERKGPRMRVTGAIVDGAPPVWPFSEAVDTPEAGRAAVRRLHEAGVDFIKVYQLLKPEVHEAVCDEAERIGLMPLGHVPSSITVEQAIANGQRTIEHLTGFDAMMFRHSHPDHAGALDMIAASRGWTEAVDIDDATLRNLVAPLANPRVAHCPTFAVFDGIRSFAAGSDPNERYHPAMMKSFWDGGGYKEWGRMIERQMPTMLRVGGALHEAGAPIIAGTDLANPGVVAGASLHRELELLVAAGLTPLEALRAATVTPAAFFGFDDLGAIAPGGEASLLLLRDNPLDDIAATRSIETVVHRGEVYDRAALDTLLDEAAAAAAGQIPAPAGDAFAEVPEFDMPGEAVASGVYKYTFGQFDAGRETFRITRTDDGYHLTAHAKFSGGPTPPSVTTARTDPARRFLAGAYRTIGRDAPAATYTIADGQVIAALGDDEQSLPAPDGAIVAGPAAATDFFVLPSLGLAVGESVTPPYIGFGNPTWRLTPLDSTITRLENGEITLPGGRRIATSVYQQVIAIPGMGEMRATTHVDADGVVVASVLKLPMGELRIELVEFAKPE